MTDQDRMGAIADTLVADEALQAQEVALAGEGGLEKANALYRRSIGASDPDGEQPSGEEGDAAESLPDIGPSPDGEWTFDRPEVVSHQFAMMEAEFGDLATDLRDDWGADAGQNMKFAAAASREFETHYPEIVETITRRGAVTDPLVVELLAVLGRQWAETPGDPATVKLFPGRDGHEQETNMNEIDADSFDEKTTELMNQQDQATAAHDDAKAQRIERQLRQMFVRRYGTGPAIGSSGGPTA